MLIYAGIDEAGYGPMLGPLVVGCTVFCLPAHDAERDGSPKLWELLKTAVARDLRSAKGRVIVNDSKKLKLPNDNLNKPRAKHPLTHLELGVLSFLQQLVACDEKQSPIECPATDAELFKQVVRGSRSQFEHLDWYLGDEQPLPVGCDAGQLRIATNSLQHALEAHEIQVRSMSCELLTERAFNEHVEQMHSKAAVNLMLIGRFLGEIMESFGHLHPRVIVDRQSGRARYRDVLHSLFPDADIRIVVEEADFSRYCLATPSQEKQMTITFAKKAEEKHMPVALASMMAKYTRELFMGRLNRYFQSHLPELKPTAGYVQDARRFLIDVEPVIRKVGVDRDIFVRKC